MPLATLVSTPLASSRPPSYTAIPRDQWSTLGSQISYNSAGQDYGALNNTPEMMAAAANWNILNSFNSDGERFILTPDGQKITDVERALSLYENVVVTDPNTPDDGWYGNKLVIPRMMLPIWEKFQRGELTQQELSESVQYVNSYQISEPPSLNNILGDIVESVGRAAVQFITNKMFGPILGDMFTRGMFKEDITRESVIDSAVRAFGGTVSRQVINATNNAIPPSPLKKLKMSNNPNPEF